jgi:protein TonB
MFEQATLTNGPAGKRVWTTFLGMTSQVALVSMAVLAPMVWPQVLPATHFWESLAPPIPPGPQPLRELKAEPVRVRTLRQAPWDLTRYQPLSVPTKVYTLIEEPQPSGPLVMGAPVGMSSGPSDFMTRFLTDASSNMLRVTPPHVAEAPKAAAPVIPRYRQGGLVVLGQPLFKAEPVYPPLAKTTRVSGDVKLECVVGVNGHILEVKVIGGHPLLVRAAVEAAWKWVYAPSKLNDTPIEIVTNLTFSFKLN